MARGHKRCGKAATPLKGNAACEALSTSSEAKTKTAHDVVCEFAGNAIIAYTTLLDKRSTIIHVPPPRMANKWPTLVKFSPNLAEIGSSLAEVGQHRVRFDRLRARFGRIPANLGQVRAKIGRMLVKFG